MTEKNNSTKQDKAFLSQSNKMLILTGLITASMVTVFYSFARANVLPSILAAFNGMQFYAVVSISAVLTMSVCTPIAGKLGDLFGRKKLYIGSALLFFLSLVGCAIAPNVPVYTACIALAGGSQGFVSAFNNAIIADFATEEECPKYVGYNSTMSTVIQIAAPLLTGIITDQFGWRTVFMVGLPFPIISIILLAKFLPDYKKELARKPKIDYIGIVMFLGALVPLLILLSVGGTMIPWASPISFALIAVAVVCAVILVFVDTRHEEPMISFYLFKDSSYLKIFLASLLSGVASGAVAVYLPYYLQNVMGLSTTLSGTLITPRTIVTTIVTALVGVVLGKSGKYKQALVLMLGVSVVSYGAMTFLFTPTTSVPMFLAITIVNGLGSTAMVVAIIALSMRILPRKDIGVGVSFLVFTTTFGGSVGNALGGLFTNSAWKNISIPSELLAALSPEQAEQLSASSILRNKEAIEAIRGTLSPDLAGTLDSTIESFRLILNQGVSNLFLAFTILCAVSLLLVLSLKLPIMDTPKQNNEQ